MVGYASLTHPTRLPSSPEDLDIQRRIKVLSYLYFSCILARNARLLRRLAGNQSRNRFPGLGDHNLLATNHPVKETGQVGFCLVDIYLDHILNS